jgi:predicted DNA-binding ribbon-helix-helix protein
MKSLIVKRSIVIDGHKTSVSLEDAFWSDLKKIAHAQEATLSELVAKINQTRESGTLSTAIRLFVLEHAQHGWMKAAGTFMGLPREFTHTPQHAALRQQICE